MARKAIPATMAVGIGGLCTWPISAHASLLSQAVELEDAGGHETDAEERLEELGRRAA